MFKFPAFTLLLLAATLSLGACSVPSQAIRTDFTHYNETIQYNQSQQLLLNLVRMKYRETPLFLKSGDLFASYNFDANLGLSVSKSPGFLSRDASLGTSFSTSPSISYTPLEGETFIGQLLTPVEQATFVLLLQSGWPVDLLTHMMVERIGDERINTDDEDKADQYAAFRTLVTRLKQAQRRGTLGPYFRDVVVENKETTRQCSEIPLDDGSGDSITSCETSSLSSLNTVKEAYLRLAPAARSDSNQAGARGDLLAHAGAFDLLLSLNMKIADSSMAVALPEELPLNQFQFRSLHDILFFLGKNTQVPAEQQGWVSSALDCGDASTSPYLTIRCSKLPPGQALVTVRHHNHYFYIPQEYRSGNDHSKDTFALLMQLFQIQGGDIQTASPLRIYPR